MDMLPAPYVDVLHDARNLPLPFVRGQFTLVYMSHVLEHIPWTQTVSFLQEIHRILEPGGVVEIWVPDFEKIVQSYLSKTPGDPWRKFNPAGDYMTWVNGRIFTYGPEDENWHRAVFDYQYLVQCLEAAGFHTTKRLTKPRGYDHGPINLGVSGER